MGVYFGKGRGRGLAGAFRKPPGYEMGAQAEALAQKDKGQCSPEDSCEHL